MSIRKWQCQVATKPSLQIALDCPICVVHNNFLMRINTRPRSFSTHTNPLLWNYCRPSYFVGTLCGWLFEFLYILQHSCQAWTKIQLWWLKASKKSLGWFWGRHEPWNHIIFTLTDNGGNPNTLYPHSIFIHINMTS